MFKLFSTKTVLGAIVTALGYLSDPTILALLPHKAAAIVTAVGGVLTALGIRHAIDQGAGVVQPAAPAPPAAS